MYKELFTKAKDNNLENFQILEISTEELDIKIFNDQIDKFETSDITKYIVSANYNNKDVRIVTEKIDNNIIDLIKEQAEYIDIDKKFLQRYYNGTLLPAHLADLFRLKLLADYGGLWIDATIYLIKDLEDIYFNKQFFQ